MFTITQQGRTAGNFAHHFNVRPNLDTVLRRMARVTNVYPPTLLASLAVKQMNDPELGRPTRYQGWSTNTISGQCKGVVGLALVLQQSRLVTALHSSFTWLPGSSLLMATVGLDVVTNI